MKKLILKIVSVIVIVVVLFAAILIIDTIRHKDDCCSPCDGEEICMTVCARCKCPLDFIHNLLD